MPIQVVLAEVEHRCYRRLKVFGIVQLKAGQLQHPDLRQGLGFQDLGQRVEQRWTDVAGHGHGFTGTRYQLARQRGDGGFAIGAGNRNDLGLVSLRFLHCTQGLRKQAQFAANPQALRTGGIDQGADACRC